MEGAIGDFEPGGGRTNERDKSSGASGTGWLNA